MQAPTRANFSLRLWNDTELYLDSFNAPYQLKPPSTSVSQFTFSLREPKPRSVVGCYAAASNQAPFFSTSFGNTTVSRCYQQAATAGLRYFALQSFGLCTAGNEFNPGSVGILPQIACHYSCTANSSTSVTGFEMQCGRASAAAVYSIDDSSPRFVRDNALDRTIVSSVSLRCRY
jgi:hypothetical protein